ncbi:MAG: TIGR02680 family protein [Burkholderiaceae bacterium]|nr:TIGR02680 family protein [Burkholderiaceae bacterium]
MEAMEAMRQDEPQGQLVEAVRGPAAVRPALPEPLRQRWQPLRIGLVELYRYDSEEFWFRDGHLLLRGNNGTGKSKVLSLTLPFLFDAQLRSSRIEPDGDSGKKMSWNLLMDSYPRRIGYTWIEFGRLADDGCARYLTLGAGLSAVTGRAQVDSWFFVIDDAADRADRADRADAADPADGAERAERTGAADHADAAHRATRIGRDLWLVNDQRVVLTRERLREAIEGRGQVYENATSYRRAVDERLFHLGTRRYDALMDTLIQLRQPQLSRKPDEAGLSHALTEALPPMPQELLTDVAEALDRLEEDRRQLDEIRELAQAVERFDRRYRIYAGMLSRRQARELRQAQTEFDNASQERNRAHENLGAAQAAEAQAQAAREHAERALAARRSRQETLQSDPTMQDANRLEGAERDAARRRRAVENEDRACIDARERMQREQQATEQCARRATRAERALLEQRRDCAHEAQAAGVVVAFAENALAALPPEALACLASREFDPAAAGLRGIASARREQLSLLQRRHDAVRQATSTLTLLQGAQRERQAEFEEAVERRGCADDAAERAAQAFVDDWRSHCARLVELRFDSEEALDALNEWVLRPEGENPAQRALAEAQRDAGERHAARQVELAARRDALHAEREALEIEHERLVAGGDDAPPAPHTRGADARSDAAGAPLWQLIDFREHVDANRRAGLEAALEASGLLDAWVTPDGVRLAIAGEPTWLDSQWLRRPAAAGASLADWLHACLPADSPVSSQTVDALLAGVACGDTDPDAVEAWISPQGRFRLGALAGAWTKREATYIGHAARAAARQRRLEGIARRVGEIEAEGRENEARFETLDAQREQARHEWRTAPSEQPLRQALLEAAARAREVQATRARLDGAETQCRDAERTVEIAREALHRDAIDLRLPREAESLPAIEQALQRFTETQFALAQAAHEWRRSHADLIQQRARETDAQVQLQLREESLAAARVDAEEAQARFEALRETVGAQVDSLRRQLADARAAVDVAEATLRAAVEARQLAGEERASAAARAQIADSKLGERVQQRAVAVARLQHFAASSLLHSALPDVEVPELQGPWTIDPALNLARRVEQALAEIADDDASWSRVQQRISEDLQELQRALSALGHQAPAEATDWGFVVHIVFHNRPERPDRLAAQLADDIAQRSELLSANERAVLENHLQAEIASEVQRLLRSAEKQVEAINRELHKRPTSTGVRYRLQWQPLGEDEGAPVGLEAARARLLNTSAELWSAEDRRVVGHMLQQRIAAERERADADTVGSEHGSLIEQLARALDYRRWHRFRVQRLQDGQWRRLSGPASSGERALGLTVPLFAAIASFYSQGCNPNAPRLMLLDEAFAGIDDAARAHCMGLVHEFDLDFVLTSEREWGCYAELPGVSICQLQRREGIDAVFVSRWTWDGRARRREADPDRRFAPA